MGSLVKINWATDSDKSSWYGVTCNNDKEVVEIRIFQSLMFGLFPPEVELLADTLQVLDLRENYLLTTEFDVGNRWLAKMTKLRMLLVGRTSFECPIPWYLNSTVALEELDISNTYYMEGPIRAWAEAFEGWNKLRYDVDTSSSNVYTSTVPTAISNLPNLEFFYLNNVSGVTQSLGFLLSIPEIIECWVDNTEMEGGILSDLPSTLCCLSGLLPTELENLKLWIACGWIRMAWQEPSRPSWANSRISSISFSEVIGCKAKYPKTLGATATLVWPVVVAVVVTPINVKVNTIGQSDLDKIEEQS